MDGCWACRKGVRRTGNQKRGNLVDGSPVAAYVATLITGIPHPQSFHSVMKTIDYISCYHDEMPRRDANFRYSGTWCGRRVAGGPLGDQLTAGVQKITMPISQFTTASRRYEYLAAMLRVACLVCWQTKCHDRTS